MTSSPLFAAVLMGLIGSLHCAGMCGPLMLLLPFGQLSPLRRSGALALYHLGRISIYALMGGILHSFKALFHPEWQQGISIGLGMVFLAGGLYSFGARGKTPALPWAGWLRQQAARFMGRPSLGALLGAGVLNGLLPCGLVYMALAVAATVPDAFDAVLSMYAFGVGTVPMLLGIVVFKQRARLLGAAGVRRYVPLMLVACGGLFVLRGANLGIPYLSPKVEIAAGSGDVKSSCCHRE